MEKLFKDENKQSKLVSDHISILTQNIPGYVFYKDEHSRYLWCNSNFANLIGYESYLDLFEKTDFDLDWNKEYIKECIVDDQEVLCTGASSNKSYKIYNKKLHCWLFVQFEKKPVYTGKKISGIVATGIDITVCKNQEQTKKKEFSFLQDIFYKLPGLIYWKNLNLQYMGFNENVVKLSGLSKNKLLGKSDLELKWGELEAQSFRNDDIEIISTGVSKTSEYELPIKRLDGHSMVVKTVKSPLRDVENKIIGVLAVAIDITDQKILELDLTAAKNKVDRLNQVKTDFICNMEHDIRTPFAGINGISLMLEDLETDGKKKKLLNAISQSSKELLDYCNAILDFSAIESGLMLSSLRTFSLKDLIGRIIRIEKAAILEKSLHVTETYSLESPRLFKGDAHKIERILINIIGNAIKFTLTGTISIDVNLAKIVNERECIIEVVVKDTGIGIPNDKISFIFENFSRLSLSNQGKYKGSGLGLSIVQSLITDIKGEIDVESKVGEGTTFKCLFTLAIPLLEPSLRKK